MTSNNKPVRRLKSAWQAGVLLPFLLAVGACSRESASQAPPASAGLINSQGERIGVASLVEMGQSVRVNLQVSALEPGEHGFHIHEKGVCEAPDFTSAGGHFNPTAKQHGFEAGDGPHVGDLRNLRVDASGHGSAERMIDGVNLGSGDLSLIGKAIVIHAKPDDYRSQPSGDAGGRVACGVIGRPMASQGR